jgi:hypothetical protein
MINEQRIEKAIKEKVKIFITAVKLFADLEQPQAGSFKTRLLTDLGAYFKLFPDSGWKIEDYIRKKLPGPEIFETSSKFSPEFKRWLLSALEREYFLPAYYALYEKYRRLGNSPRKEAFVLRLVKIINLTPSYSSQQGRIKELRRRLKPADWENHRFNIKPVRLETVPVFTGPIVDPASFKAKRDYLLAQLLTGKLKPDDPGEAAEIYKILAELLDFHYQSLAERTEEPAAGSGKLIPGILENKLPEYIRDREEEILELLYLLEEWRQIKYLIEANYHFSLGSVQKSRINSLEEKSGMKFYEIPGLEHWSM